MHTVLTPARYSGTAYIEMAITAMAHTTSIWLSIAEG